VLNVSFNKSRKVNAIFGHVSKLWSPLVSHEGQQLLLAIPQKIGQYSPNS
jgi:hypothetical protein